jgi:hypothetical protein
MAETPGFDDFEKQQIVTVLNEQYQTTLSVELVEIAVTCGFTTWEALQWDASRPCECGCGLMVLGGLLERAHSDDYRNERG